MNVRIPLRTLVMASALALTVLSLPGADAYAGPIQDQRKKECTQRGFDWSEKLGCADKNCSDWYGKYRPGETLIEGGKMYMCDGYTGNWIEVRVRTAPPTGPAGGVPAPSGAYAP